MQQTTLEFKEAIKKDARYMKTRISHGKSVYTNDDIYTYSVDSGIFMGEVLGIGSSYATEAKITFDKLVEDFKELDEVLIEIGVDRPKPKDPEKFNLRMGEWKLGEAFLNKFNAFEETEYIQIGKFYVTNIEHDRNAIQTKLELKDAMIFFEKPYERMIKYYPSNIEHYANEICTKAGVFIEGASFISLPDVSLKWDSNDSLRQYLSYVAQAGGRGIVVNSEGYLELRTFKRAEKDGVYKVGTDNYFSKGLTKNDFSYRVGGIRCVLDQSEKGAVLQAGPVTGPQIILENKMMTKEALQRLYEEYKGIEFFPFSLNWRYNPAVEAGDLLEVSDLAGKKYIVPNLGLKIDYDGGMKANSFAETKPNSQEVVPSGMKTIDQRFAELKDLYSKLESDVFMNLGELAGNIGDLSQQNKDDVLNVGDEVNKEIEQKEQEMQELEDKINDTIKQIEDKVIEQGEEWEQNWHNNVGGLKDEILDAVNQPNAIKGSAIKVDYGFISKLMSDQILVNQLFADSAFIRKLDAKMIKTIELEATKIITDQLDAIVITAEMIRVDEALIDKLFANEAFFRKLVAKDAFIRNLSTVTLKALNINGGHLYGPNIDIDLTRGTIEVDGGYDGYKLKMDSGQLIFSDSGGNRKKMTLNKNGIHNYDSYYGKRELKFVPEGLEIRAGTSNTGDRKNSGLELIGDKSYVDFHTGFGTSSLIETDWDARIISQNRNRGNREGGALLRSFSYGFDLCVEDDVKVRTLGDEGWRIIRALEFKPNSQLKHKNILEKYNSGLVDLRKIDFYEYSRDDGNDRYLGLITDYVKDNLPIVADEEGVSLYSLVSLIGQGLKELDKQVSSFITFNAMVNDEQNKKIKALENKVAMLNVS